MKVIPSFVHASLDSDGNMFDFEVYFFIINPMNTNVEAKYSFDRVDKKHKTSKSPSEESFLGADELDINDRKPYKFDTFTGKGIGVNVNAQVELASTHAKPKGFTITVSLRGKLNHSIDVTFKGDTPSWLDLDNKQVHHGVLMMYEVKDLSPPAP